jgi:pheromone shutdown protein TraB
MTGVFKGTMSKIPIIKKGLEHSLRRAVMEMRKGDNKSVEYLTAFWKSFKEEQPHLSKLVIKEMNHFKSQKVMAAFAHGVWMTYAALKSQEEADEMNRDWGI